jgi:hypothetical protein
MSEPNSRPSKRTKNLIDGLSESEVKDRVYAIAESVNYRTNSEDWVPANQNAVWPIMQPDDFNWLVNTLIPRHGDAEIKIGKGIAELTFVGNYRAAKTLSRMPCAMFARRVDGSVVDISWVECIKPNNHRSKVLNAMRASVQVQIDEFRSNTRTVICEVCQKRSEMLFFDETGFDVDHHPLPFIKIAENWLLIQGLDFDNINVNGHREFLKGDEFVDPFVKLQWSQYHKEIAELRILCRPCHKSKKRK